MACSRRLLRLLVIALLTTCPAFSDEVHLRDGRKLEGTVTDNGETLTIKMRFGSLTVKKSDVLRIVKKQSARETFAQRRKALKKTDVAGRLRLAAWAGPRGMRELATKLYREVIALDPDNEVAREALGHVRRKGQWMTRDEAMRAAGMVKHKGQWRLKEVVELEQRQAYIAAAKVARVVLIDQKQATIELTHATLGSRSVPARISRLSGEDTILVEGLKWPVSTEVELAGYPVLLAYKIKLRLGNAGDGGFRLGLARWLKARGQPVEAAAEATEAIKRDPQLTAQARQLLGELQGDKLRVQLARTRALWNAGQTARALAQLERLIAAGLGSLTDQATQLRDRWRNALAGREQLLARLARYVQRLEPKGDPAARAFCARLRAGLTPAAVTQLASRLAAPAEDRAGVRAQLQALDVGLAYRYVPQIATLSPARVLAVERWLARYRTTDQARQRRKQAGQLRKTFPGLTLIQLGLILRHRLRAQGAVMPGISKHALTIRQDKSQTSYHLVTPRNYSPHQRWPLLIYLHGKGGSGAASIGAWQALADRYGLIVCCPTAKDFRYKGWGGTPQEYSIVFSALADLRRKVWVDTGRVYLGGVSMGGHGTWDIGLHHADRFAALFPMLGGPRIKHYRLLPGLRHTAVYDAQGALDDPRLVRGVRFAMTRLSTLGYKSKYQEALAIRHQPIPGAEAAFLEWVKALKRPSYPKKVTLRATTQRHARNAWLEVRVFDRVALDPKAPLKIPGFRRLAEADRLRRIIDYYEKQVMSLTGEISSANRIELTVNAHVRRVRIHLAPEMIDFGQPLRVSWNGKTVFNGRVRAHPSFLLERARSNPDRPEVYFAAIDVSGK